MINLLCLLHLFRLFRCFFGTDILELLHVVEWKCRYWTGEELCPPLAWGPWLGGQGPGALHPEEGCLLYVPHLLILDRTGTRAVSCTAHSWVSTSCTLALGIHLQKTAMSPSDWCHLGFEEVLLCFHCWEEKGAAECLIQGIGLCWRPTCCPGTTLVEFCKLPWHRTRVPCSMVVKGWWGRQCVLWWPMALVRWWEREGTGCWTRWCSYKLCTVKHLASKYLLKCVST